MTFIRFTKLFRILSVWIEGNRCLQKTNSKKIPNKVSELVAVMCLGAKTTAKQNHFLPEREIIIKSENQFAIKFTFIVLSTRPKKEGRTI